MVQRGKRHSALSSCQRSYPLSFRRQVCEAQGLLPCFSPTVLVPWRLPSLSRVPVGPVPRVWSVLRRRYDFPLTQSRSLIGSLPSSTRSLQCSCSPHGAPGSVEDRPEPGHLFSRLPKVPARSPVGMGGISQVPRRSVPYLCPAPRPRSDRRAHGHWRSRRCCPRSNDSEGSSKRSISRLIRGFGTCCLRFQNDVAVSPARLASGWLARLCREGVEPSGSQ
jgi:hypothetical protein